MDRQLRDLMPHTVTVNTASTKRSDGSQAYSTAATSYTARVVNVRRHQRDGRGNVAMAAYDVWIDSTSVLSPQSKYTLPDGSTPPVLAVSCYPDQSGNYHNKVTFGAV